MDKILYIAHGNNDVDHYLPIMYRLDEKHDVMQSVIYVYQKETVLQNKVHLHMINRLKLTEISLNLQSSMKNTLRLYSRCEKMLNNKIKRYQNTDLDIVHRYFLKTLQLFRVIMNGIFNRFKAIIFPISMLADIVTKHKYSLVVIDTQNISKLESEKNAISFALYNILAGAKKNKVPIFMISHGAAIRYPLLLSKKEISHNTTNIYPDVLALCNEQEKKLLQHFVGSETEVLALGDVRYDSEWIRQIERVASDVCRVESPRNTIIVLLVVANLTFLKERVNDIIHSDVIDIINHYDDVEVWIKAHPRYPKTITHNAGSRVRVFYNEIDTNALISRANIVVSALSGVLFQPIIKGQRVIYYDKWKMFDSNNMTTVFDANKCVVRASSKQELIQAVNLLRREKILGINLINEFYSEVVSGGIPIDESIAERYVKKIRTL